MGFFFLPLYVASMLHGAADSNQKSPEIKENKLQHARQEKGRRKASLFQQNI
jgi:hypothetical protein